MELRWPEAPPARALRKFTLPMNEPVSYTAVSPNGKHIAYTVRAGVLVVLDLETGETRELVDGGVGRLFWSPDSGFIGFSSGAGGRRFVSHNSLSRKSMLP